MNKLSKEQKAVLECALDKLYTYLKEKFNEDYKGNILCIVHDNLIKLHQCSLPNHIAWEVNIWLEERRIHIITREVDHDAIYSKRYYDLFYMGSKPTIHTVHF